MQHILLDQLYQYASLDDTVKVWFYVRGLCSLDTCVHVDTDILLTPVLLFVDRHTM